jgi:hypothetical protein
MLGFKSFDAAQGTLAGIALMHMIKKKQLVVEAGGEDRTAAGLVWSKYPNILLSQR